jgi:uncharacterized protein (TIGR03663 family)
MALLTRPNPSPEGENNNTLSTWLSQSVWLNWELIAWVIIFALAIFTRFYLLGERTMSHDESLHTVFSHNLFERGDFKHNPMMHGTVLFHATALMYQLFGVSDFSARIYPAVLGIMMVMFPLLMRPWFGRKGAILAGVMILGSPLLLYYNRYIREDTPAILATMIMFYATIMYTNGSAKQRGKAYWLYILAAANLWNLASKETGFFYVAIFGAFLTLYLIVRLIQHYTGINGKLIFHSVTLSILTAGVLSILMVMVLSIAMFPYPTLDERLLYWGNQLAATLRFEAIGTDFSTFLVWTGSAVVSMLAVVIGTGIWAYRKRDEDPAYLIILDIIAVIFSAVAFFLISRNFSTITVINENGEAEIRSMASAAMSLGWVVAMSFGLVYAAFRLRLSGSFTRLVVALLAVAAIVLAGLIVVEELSHAPARDKETVAQPAEPGIDQAVVVDSETFTVTPIVWTWIIGAGVILVVINTKVAGWWRVLKKFPEFDVCMVLGALTLPWLAAIVLSLTHSTPADWVAVGSSAKWITDLLPLNAVSEADVTLRTGQFIIGFMSWFPLMAVSVVGGLAWNWRRYLMASLVFYLLFLFFYTTMFTNPEGIASGFVYSLQYWMEQQGEKRGNQPQYYYTLVVMPFYEFLPIIGSMLAMISGYVFFWRKNREKEETLQNNNYPGGLLFGVGVLGALGFALWRLSAIRRLEPQNSTIQTIIAMLPNVLLVLLGLLVAWLVFRLWLEWSRRARLAKGELTPIPTALFNSFFALTGVIIGLRHLMILAGSPVAEAESYQTYQTIYTILTVLVIPLAALCLLMVLIWVAMMRQVWFIKDTLRQRAIADQETPTNVEGEQNTQLPPMEAILPEATPRGLFAPIFAWLMRELGYIVRWGYEQLRRPMWVLLAISIVISVLVIAIINNHFFLLSEVPTTQYIIFTLPNLANGGAVLSQIIISILFLFGILGLGLIWMLLGYELAPQNAGHTTSIRKNWARLTRLTPRIAGLLPRSTSDVVDEEITSEIDGYLPPNTRRWWSNLFSGQILSIAFFGILSLLIAAVAFYLLFWDSIYLIAVLWDGRGIQRDIDLQVILQILGFLLQIVGLVVIPLAVGMFAMLQAYNLLGWMWSALAVKSPEMQPASSTDEIPTRILSTEDEPVGAWKLTEVPVMLFISWWAVFNLLAYTLAGEKMPWLGTHMTVPMIFLTAWYFGRTMEQIEWRKFAQRGWVYLFILPLMMVALFRLIMPVAVGEQPFLGTTQVQLDYTYNWLGALVLFLGGGYFAIILARKLGWSSFRQMVAVTSFAVLMVVTFRSAWTASFINYDLPTEYLVYAHGGPANKSVIEAVADVSMRMTGGLDIKIMHDNRFSWPGSWYLRDFTNVQYIDTRTPSQEELANTMVVIVGDSNNSKIEPLVRDNYQKFTYKRMWWPYQDAYWDLTATKINDWLSLSDPNASLRRRGWFDIWWARDYDVYEQAIFVQGRAFNTDFDLTKWPVSDTMYVYIRKDIAAQVWLYGVGDGSPLSQFTQLQVNVCNQNFVDRQGIFIFQNQTQPLTRPIGLAIDAQGNVIVAEESEQVSQISIFDASGTLQEVYGQPGPASLAGTFFNRPHSVGVSPNGVVYVADTWNYRIRAFDAQFNQLNMWGQPLTLGAEALTEPLDGFWGPRDVKVDMNGFVYVSDTGNRRIRVYTPDGIWVRDIGRSGSNDGGLNEPAGIALHPDGRIFIADTWNKRIAIFNTDGTFIKNFEVRGWYDDFGNRPYLALDVSRQLLYVSDPDASRILMYDTEGNCIGSFGGPAQGGTPNLSQFGVIGGLATDSLGNLYVSDMTYGRVVKFAPYDRPGVIPQTNLNDLLPPINLPETTPEVIVPVEITPEVEVTVEMTVESTPEAVETTPETTPTN